MIFDGLMTTNGLQINFDTLTYNFPRQVRMTWYREDEQIGNSIIDVTSPMLLISNYFLRTDKVELEFLSMNKGGQRLRVTELMFGNRTTFHLTRQNMIAHSQQIINEPVRNINVFAYNYTPGEHRYLHRQLYNGSQTILIRHSGLARNKTASVSVGTITRQIHYAYASEITVQHNGEFELILAGTEMIESTVISSRQVFDVGQDMSLENPMISELENSQQVADWLYYDFIIRTDYTSDHRGFPESQAGDYIYLETNFNPKKPVRILESTVTFNGALRGTYFLKGVEI